MGSLFNTPEEIYSRKIQFDGEKYICPVCEKEFVRQGSAVKHYEKQSCHRYRHIFENTMTEQDIYEVYRNIQYANGYGAQKLSNFRKTAHYTVISKVMEFCWSQDIQHRGAFILFVIQNRGKLDHMRALKYCTNETMLKRFRGWMRFNISDELSESFYNSNKTYLWEDTQHMLRAIEKGEVGIKWLMANVDFAPFVARLEGYEVDQFERLIL